MRTTRTTGPQGSNHPREPGAVVWNRARDATRGAVLIVRDAREGGCSEIVIDQGESFLIGVRHVGPNQPHIVESWRQWAIGEGVEFRDERTPRALEAAQSVRQDMAHALQEHERRKAARRDAEPPGGLFDLTTRDQGGLFDV